MKKILYSTLVLLAAAFVGCSEEDNGANAVDSKPVVTVYEIATSANVDPDTSIALRLAPNSVTEEYYVLAITEADREAYVATNGESAFAEYVAQNGDCYTDARKDLEFTGLSGKYVIAVVAVAKNGDMQLYETPFQGLVWLDYAQGQYQSNIIYEMWGGAAPHIGVVTMQRCDGTNNYRLVNPYLTILAPIKGKWESSGFAFSDRAHFTFAWEEGATAIQPLVATNGDGYYPFPTGLTNAQYGPMSFTVDADPAYSLYVPDLTGTGIPGFVLNGKFTGSAGYIGDWVNDYFLILQKF